MDPAHGTLARSDILIDGAAIATVGLDLATDAAETRQFDPIHAGCDLAAFVAGFDS